MTELSEGGHIEPKRLVFIECLLNGSYECSHRFCHFWDRLLFALLSFMLDGNA